MEFERLEILIGGRGGQGILLTGYILGKAFIKEGYYVVNSEIYSAETRGGFSRSDLIVTRNGEEPDLIRISSADIAIFMYPEQMKIYSPLVSYDAKVFIDSSFVSTPEMGWGEVYHFPFTDVARKELRNHRVANMVAIGYFIGKTDVLKLDTVKYIIQNTVRKNWVEINLDAVELGYRAAKEDVN